MNNKDLLIDLCRQLQDWLSEKEQRIVPVEFFSDLRPLMGFDWGTGEWVVAIKVDGEVVFKDFYVPKKTEDLKIVEGMLITRIIRSIFFHGIAAARASIEEARKHSKSR